MKRRVRPARRFNNRSDLSCPFRPQPRKNFSADRARTAARKGRDGRAAGAVSDVRHAFSNAVARGGFVCRHVIRMDEKGEHVLEEWKRHDVQLMLMFWSAEGGKTMFSWGTFHE